MDFSSVTPIALGFILIFALVGLLRGGLRVLASFVALALAGVVAIPLGPFLQGLVATTPVPLALQPAAALALGGLLVFLFARITLGVLLAGRERRRRKEGLPRHSAFDRGLGAVLGAAWGALIVVVVLGGLRLIADVQAAMELSAAVDSAIVEGLAEEGAIPPPSSPSSRAGGDQVAAFLESEPPPGPTRPPSTKRSPGNKPPSSLLDPLVRRASPLGAHQGQAIRDLLALLEDPDSLERLRNQPEIRQLMENPLIVEASSDPEITRAVQRRDLIYLLNHPTVAELAKNPELRHQILDLDFEDLLRRSRG